MRERPPKANVVSVGPYELWMLAQGAMGFVGVGGMMFLIPLSLNPPMGDGLRV